MPTPPAATTAPSAVRGRHVLVDGVFRPATLVLREGRIAEVLPRGAPVTGAVLEVPDSVRVLPGVVDTHVHVNEPGRTEWEGFASATRAAALGGVTTLVDMPLNAVPPTTTVDHLRLKQRAAAHQLAVDVAFWGGAVPGNLPHLRPLWEAGVLGFKCFLSPSGVDEFPPLEPADFTAALGEVAGFDGLVIVHAEDPAVLAAAPAPPSRAYADFLLSRPDEAELAAIRRVVQGARETGCRVHVLHLASARALDLLADARAEGLPVTVETCPHYLCFDADGIPDGAPQFKCCPPIRDAGNRDALWQGLQAGVIDCVVSDHSPATAEEKNRGDGDLQQAWGGVAGLQVGFVATAAEARARGIGLEHVSRWMSQHTAALAGLDRAGSDGSTGAKGRIAVGADADLLLYDTASELRVEAVRLAHKHPISAYDGEHYTGRVLHTLLRGRVLETPHPALDQGIQLGRPDVLRNPAST